jgi:alpha-L-arabinofuranosidase
MKAIIKGNHIYFRHWGRWYRVRGAEAKAINWQRAEKPLGKEESFEDMSKRLLCKLGFHKMKVVSSHQLITKRECELCGDVTVSGVGR